MILYRSLMILISNIQYWIWILHMTDYLMKDLKIVNKARGGYQVSSKVLVPRTPPQSIAELRIVPWPITWDQ